MSDEAAVEHTEEQEQSEKIEMISDDENVLAVGVDPGEVERVLESRGLLKPAVR